MGWDSVKDPQSIEKLCEILAHEKADYYEESAIIYKNNPELNRKKGLPFHFYLNNIKDICWKLALKKIESGKPELELEKINIDRLISGAYDFSEDSLERVYIKEKNKRSKCEGIYHELRCQYENLMKIRGIPLIIESSLGGFQSLDKNNIKIIHETLLSRPYYILIIPKEHAERNAGTRTSKYHIILPWSISKDEFIEGVKHSLEKNCIKYYNSS